MNAKNLYIDRYILNIKYFCNFSTCYTFTSMVWHLIIAYCIIRLKVYEYISQIYKLHLVLYTCNNYISTSNYINSMCIIQENTETDLNQCNNKNTNIIDFKLYEV